MSDRKMEVKMSQHISKSHDLIGGAPQGSLIRQLLYIISSDYVAAEVPDEDKYKYIDYLAVLEAVNKSDKLRQYNVWQHIPTDVATEQKFLPPNTFKSQQINNSISAWPQTTKLG